MLSSLRYSSFAGRLPSKTQLQFAHVKIIPPQGVLSLRVDIRCLIKIQVLTVLDRFPIIAVYVSSSPISNRYILIDRTK